MIIVTIFYFSFYYLLFLLPISLIITTIIIIIITIIILEIQRLKELAIGRVGQLIKVTGDFGALASFVRSLKGLWAIFPRAKTAKIVKGLLDQFEKIGSDPALLTEIELCRELLAWSEEEKRSFLKQALETRLVSLFHRTDQYSEALSLVADLIRQL